MIAGIFVAVGASYFVQINDQMSFISKIPTFSELIQFMILIVLLQISKMLHIYLNRTTEDLAELLFMCNSTGGTFLKIYEKLGYLELRI